MVVFQKLLVTTFIRIILHLPKPKIESSEKLDERKLGEIG